MVYKDNITQVVHERRNCMNATMCLKIGCMIIMKIGKSEKLNKQNMFLQICGYALQLTSVNAGLARHTLCYVCINNIILFSY